MDSPQVVAFPHSRGRGQVISRKGCGCTGVLCVGPIPTHPTKVVQASTATQAKCMQPIWAKCPTRQDRQRLGRQMNRYLGRATEKYKYLGFPFVANHGTQDAHYARGLHGGHNWRDYMAGDVYLRSTIRPKRPKGTTCASAVEREKRITLFVRYTCSER